MVVVAGVSLGVMQPVAPLFDPKPHGYVELTVIVVDGGAEPRRAMKPAAPAADSPAAISVPAGLLSCDDHDVPMVPAGQIVLLLMVVQAMQKRIANAARTAHPMISLYRFIMGDLLPSVLEPDSV